MADKNRVDLVFMVNHMHYGGCQKIVYDLLIGIHDRFESIYLISNPGYYSELIQNRTKIKFIDRSNLSFYGIILAIARIKSKSEKLILHTHNRIDIVYKFLLRNNDSHIHTFHSAYVNKNFMYKLIKPQYSVSISNTVKKYLNQYGIENELIYNGFDINQQKYTNNNVIDVENIQLSILYIGRVTKDKGFDDLLNAILLFEHHKINCIKLEVIGDGEKLNYYKDLVRKSGSVNVKFSGFKSNPWESVNDHDLLVIPSYFEGFCLVAAEGAAIGIPIIGNNISALREVLYFSAESNFFDVHDVRSIQSSILEFVENISKNREVAIMNSERIREKFSISIMHKNYLDVYKSLIK